jgi:hypothetical protein
MLLNIDENDSIGITHYISNDTGMNLHMNVDVDVDGVETGLRMRKGGKRKEIDLDKQQQEEEDEEEDKEEKEDKEHAMSIMSLKRAKSILHSVYLVLPNHIEGLRYGGIVLSIEKAVALGSIIGYFLATFGNQIKAVQFNKDK